LAPCPLSTSAKPDRASRPERGCRRCRRVVRSALVLPTSVDLLPLEPYPLSRLTHNPDGGLAPLQWLVGRRFLPARAGRAGHHLADDLLSSPTWVIRVDRLVFLAFAVFDQSSKVIGPTAKRISRGPCLHHQPVARSAGRHGCATKLTPIHVRQPRTHASEGAEVSEG
jgi:hypothetical protein